MGGGLRAPACSRRRGIRILLGIITFGSLAVGDRGRRDCFLSQLATLSGGNDIALPTEARERREFMASRRLGQRFAGRRNSLVRPSHLHSFAGA